MTRACEISFDSASTLIVGYPMHVTMDSFTRVLEILRRDNIDVNPSGYSVVPVLMPIM
jgi:hypothetical protein